MLPVKLSFSERSLASTYFFDRNILSISTFSDLHFIPYIWMNWSTARWKLDYIGVHSTTLIFRVDIGSCFHFTREITLTDEYLSQILQDRKALCHLDDFRTTFWDLHQTCHVLLQRSNMSIAAGTKSTFGPIWVRKSPENLKNCIQILSRSTVVSNRSKAQTNNLEKLH